MKKFFSFETMLTPKLIEVFYPIAVIATAIVAIGWMIAIGKIQAVLLGVLGFIVSVVLLRVSAEQIIVIFGIYDRLGKIEKKQ